MMSDSNLAMRYPRHGLLVVCDWINLLLAVAIVAVGAYRTWGIASNFINRMDVVIITAGGKSIVFLIYILSTSYISSLKRFYNATTIFVMAIIDSLLWAAALGLTAYGMVQVPPSGTRETLTYILLALLAITLVFSFFVLYLTWKQRKYVKHAKRAGVAGGGVQEYRVDSENGGYKY